MKYVLVDKGDNIIDKVELNSELREAKKFFIKRKQIDESLSNIKHKIGVSTKPLQSGEQLK